MTLLDIWDSFWSEPFMFRSHCMLHKPWLMALYMVFNIGTTVNYIAFPALIHHFFRQKKLNDYRIKPLLITVYTFFIFCAGTHALNALSVTIWSNYYFTTLWDIVQFFVSGLAVVLFAKGMPTFLNMRTAQEYKKVSDRAEELEKLLKKITDDQRKSKK